MTPREPSRRIVSWPFVLGSGDDAVHTALICLGGRVAKSPFLAKIFTEFKEADAGVLLLAADSGAALCRVYGLIPGHVAGDMDSIDPETLAWLKTAGHGGVRCELHNYPRRKNATDGEMIVSLFEKLWRGDKSTNDITETLPQPSRGSRDFGVYSRVILIGGLGPERPDHVMMGLELLRRLRAQGITAAFTDGRSLIFSLIGSETLVVDGARSGFQCKPVVSLLPARGALRGVTYEGLAFPLDDATIEEGSSRALSNYPAAFDCRGSDIDEERYGALTADWRFSVTVREGEAWLFIGPDD